MPFIIRLFANLFHPKLLKGLKGWYAGFLLVARTFFKS
jgi:hypothetical protein